MIGRGRRLVWPVPAGVAVVTALVMVGFGWVAGLDHLRSPAVDWANLSTQAHEALFTAGLAVGLVGLWVAVRCNGAGSVMVPVDAGRSLVRVVGRQVVVLSALAYGGLMVGLAPALVDGVLRATYGGPDVLVLAGGAVATAVFVVVGVTVGTMLPTVAAVAVGLAALSAVAAVGPVAGSRWWPLTPVWSTFGAQVGQQVNPVAAGFRVVFLALVVVVLVAAAAVWLERRAEPSVASRLHGLGLLAVPLLLVGLLAVRPVDVLVDETNPPQVCGQAAHATVCVHQAKQPMLEQVVGVVADVELAAGPLAGSLEHVVDSALLDRRSALEHDEPHQEWVPVRLGSGMGGDFHWTDEAADRLAMFHSGYDSCPHQGRDYSQGLEPEDLSRVVRGWLLTRSGHASLLDGGSLGPGELVERWDGLDEATRGEWLAAHADQLHACQAHPDDLPDA